MSYLNVSIPIGIDVELLVNEMPPNGIKNFRIDKLKFIISQIVEIAAKKPKLVDENGFVPVNATILQSFIRDYNLYLEYLLAACVLFTNGQYIVGETSKKYKFIGKYNTPEIRNETISNNFLARKVYKYKEAKKNDAHAKGCKHLTKWFDDDGLKINQEAALDFIKKDFEFKINNPTEIDSKKNPEMQYRSACYCINRIAEGNFWLSVDDSGYRFHSNLTSMNSSLRNFLTYKGETLSACDLSNSQPYLSTLLFSKAFWEKNTNLSTPTIYSSYIQTIFTKSSLSIMLVKVPERLNKPDVYHFIELVSQGKLYEYFAKKKNNDDNYKIKDSKERRAIKDVIFSILYSENIHSSKGKILFEKLFPNVCFVFRLIKEEAHKNLPLLLQRLESELFLNRIAKRISKENPKLPIYTIHDNIASTSKNIEYVRRIVYEECLKFTGLEPNLKTEEWMITAKENKKLAA